MIEPENGDVGIGAVPGGLRAIATTGNSSNRIDMVFLGDGYTASQISVNYTADIQNYLSYIFDDSALTQPLGRYEKFFNVWAVDVVSNQSGADDPTAHIVRDTALDATYLFDGVTQRLLYVSDAKANAAMNTALSGSGFTGEMRYVLVNDTQYGGGGGQFGVYAAGNNFARDVALHEIGHSFAGLADEYGGNTGTYTGAEPVGLNVTKNTMGAKWSEWLGYNDPVLGVVGAYEGGFYYDHGVYRPTLNSKMRTLDRPFDPIAREEFIHKFYQFVDPLDSYDNNSGTKFNIQTLNVSVVDPAVINVDWTVNGQTFVNSGQTFDFAAHGFLNGNYTVTARAYDPTDWVRGDRSDLEQSVTWTVVEGFSAGRISINDVTVTEGNAGTRLATFTVTRSGGTAAFDINFGTANGSATSSDGDYAGISSTLHFGANVNTQAVAITIVGDTKVESDEAFYVLLGAATNGAVISDDTGIGTIINDDFSGSVTIDNVTISEGNSGSKVGTFTVTRAGGTAAFDVNFGTVDGSASTAGGDYVRNAGTLHFADGVNTQTVAVTINGDTRVESNEAFYVLLGGATNGARIGDDTGVGTIANDDTPIHDFNGDGKTDFLWRSDGGTVATWNIDDGRVLRTNDFGILPGNWKIAGTGDFNGDGKSDFLWRSDAGTIATWNINDNRVLSTNDFGLMPNNWKIAGTGDFNGDGKSDFLLRSDAGTIVTWNIDDGRVLRTNDFGIMPSNWKIAGTGDFNGDGKSDFLLRSDAGTIVTWDIDDGRVLRTNDFGIMPSNWKIAGIGDFNGDGKSDFLLRSDAGTLVSWDINDGQVLRTNDFGIMPSNWKIAGTGDFNGDSKSDFLWRSDAGTVATWNINDGQVLSTHDFGVVPNNWHII